ncbi:MAG: NADP oxidoreductase [Candidatus Eisenbacteria bacterium]|uniref:NADP oxidoreductase n=1 Tax=Eiseniibacteriota bacterium TaxID=2212470 RepID=A0A7Y2E8N9_UNCEI|nr:NADP oxidoreductase [Candidatus Eisenbacteria bacterium]
MTALGSESRPLRVAVIGSGPSGFYAAEAFFKADPVVEVDVFDRLPTPYGLVRGGVAPDHQKIKNVIKVYERIASNERFRFLGNVFVGKDISVASLQEYYDAILFTCGAETDRRLGIPGEDLPGSYTATEFVGWYNAHPDYRDRNFDLSGKVAVVIGQGNVAMDVSRILAKTVNELKETDIAAHALEALSKSNIKEIYLIGRRGPAQAKFTPPEIKEIGVLEDCEPVVKKEDLILNPESAQELEDSGNKQNKKNYETLVEFSERDDRNTSKKYICRFLEGPVAIKGDGKVQSVVLAKNKLVGEAGNQWAEATGETVEIPCDIFFRSIGYRGIAVPGVPFEERKGIFPNEKGRILEGGAHIPGLYAAGWIKRGPSGVIGTNKPDAYETVDMILEDLGSLSPCANPSTDALIQKLGADGVRVVTFDDWKRIDEAEVAQGKAAGKPREKFASTPDMLKVLDS